MDGADKDNLPTDERLRLYANGEEDHTLESLYFQYGRYLLISSSRPGTMPANLQGKWNNLGNPPWASDYHANINIQMIYWPAEVTNLSECHEPLIEYIDRLRPPGLVWPTRLGTLRVFGRPYLSKRKGLSYNERGRPILVGLPYER